MAVDIDSLQIEIEATSGDAASKIDQLATALTNLKSAAKGGAGLTTTTKQLQALSNAAKLINGTNLDSQKIQQFASAMNSLSAIQKASGLNSTINALKKLPEISTALNKADLGKFAQQMNQVASAMRPLATEMQKVANGFFAFPIRIQKIIQSNSALAASNNKTAKSFGMLGTGISSAKAKFGIYLIAFRQIASVMSDWVKESNDYVENLNLFTVAMGEYAEASKAYAEEVQAVMGIDPSEWMRNQGVFMQMTSGFGVASEDAALMSKNLTQLGYDISSFHNISIEDAMQKLQSGLAGEIEPLRRLGYAIDDASLKQVALRNGITKSTLTMTQAEKSQLRYVAIMEQSTNAMGDLSRTIQTPANAMRILNQQIVQLSRALGNMLIPILQKIIPWVRAFVEILTEAAQAIANFLGFELPTIDYSGLDNVSVGASEAEDAIGGATDAAKKMKRELLGIDELTVLEPPDSGGSAGGSGVSTGGDLGLDLPEYDFLNGLKSQTEEHKNALKEILAIATAIGAAFLAWKFKDQIVKGLKTVYDLLGSVLGRATVLTPEAQNLAKALKFAGVAAVIATISARFIDLYNNSEAFRTGIQRVGDVFSGVFGVISDVLGGIWNTIKNLGISIINLLPEEVRSGVLSFFEQMGSALEIIDLDWKDLAITAAGFGLLFVPGGQILGAALLAFEAISVGIRALGSVSDETWDEIKNTVSTVVSTIGDLVTSVITSITDFFVSEFNGVTNFFLGTFTGDWERAWDGLTEIGSASLGLLGSLTETLFGVNIVNVVSDWFSKHVAPWFTLEKWTGLASNIKTSVIKGWNNTVSEWSKSISSWWNKEVKPWFSLEKWKQLGADALEGLFSGLSNIGNKIRTWGGNLIAGVKNFFGIHSPSTVFRDEIGLNIGLGISAGIGDSESSIMSEVSKAGDIMRSALTFSDLPTAFSVESANRSIQEVSGAVAIRGNDNDDDRGNMEIINAIYAMSQQIINAINNAGGDVYLDGDKVGARVTQYQNRQNQMYGKTMQRI